MDFADGTLDFNSIFQIAPKAARTDASTLTNISSPTEIKSERERKPFTVPISRDPHINFGAKPTLVASSTAPGRPRTKESLRAAMAAGAAANAGPKVAALSEDEAEDGAEDDEGEVQEVKLPSKPIETVVVSEESFDSNMPIASSSSSSSSSVQEVTFPTPAPIAVSQRPPVIKTEPISSSAAASGSIRSSSASVNNMLNSYAPSPVGASSGAASVVSHSKPNRSIYSIPEPPLAELPSAERQASPLDIISERRKPVLYLDPAGELICEYSAMYEAAMSTRIPIEDIARCCQGWIDSVGSGGCRFKYTSPQVRNVSAHVIRKWQDEGFIVGASDRNRLYGRKIIRYFSQEKERPYEGEVVAYLPPELDESGAVTEPELFRVLYPEDGDVADYSEAELVEGMWAYDACPDAVERYHNRLLRSSKPAASSGARKKKRAANAAHDKKKRGKRDRDRDREPASRRENTSADDRSDAWDSGSEDGDTVDDGGSVRDAMEGASKRDRATSLSEEECLEEIAQVTTRISQLKNARNQLERQLKENMEEERKAKARLVQLSSWIS